MGYALGNSSKEKLDTCHIDLQKIFALAITRSKVDFGISEGHRTLARQKQLFNEGKSKIDGISQKGKHNYKPSLAVDIFAYHPDLETRRKLAYDIPHLTYLAGVIDACAEELYAKGEITHLIAASGTGGTISGVSKYLKEQNPNIKTLGVDAFGSILKKFHETGEFDKKEIYPYRIEGLGKNLIPTATDFDVIDVFEKVTDEAAAHRARELAVTEGLFTGYTSGAIIQATMQYAEQGMFNEDSKVVLILPDHGSRYMEKIYCDEWMKEQGFFDSQKQAHQEVEFIK